MLLRFSAQLIVLQRAANFYEIHPSWQILSQRLIWRQTHIILIPISSDEFEVRAHDKLTSSSYQSH
jgi:hypothetical protein